MKDRSAEVLPPPLLEAIAKGATVRAFPKNAIIVNEGDETDSVYVILSGRARVYVSNAQGREVQLNAIGPGEYFGEVTLDGGPRSASVMSIGECRCVVVKRSELLSLVEKEPGFALHLLRRVREPRECAELLLGAPALRVQLVRRVGVLELLVLNAAAHRNGDSDHANHPAEARVHRPARRRRLRGVGRVAVF